MLALIIYGTRGVTGTKAEGTFYCPACCNTVPYIHKRERRFFTLYFIPLIPLDTLQEWVECRGCGNTFEPGVIQGSQPPGWPAQAWPQEQQGYPQQGHPQQGYPQQGHPQQGYPQQLKRSRRNKPGRNNSTKRGLGSRATKATPNRPAECIPAGRNQAVMGGRNQGAARTVKAGSGLIRASDSHRRP